eukprot:TRINITY_DN68074_c0_g1_i1.p1 TRINITY_DN68074_c0_g1~~TRINITY_DN68074_c0_g1_i1.p1  ORF type:complete len:258 (+),score=40.43 TRINITY_DN68074_c0_g1_i1:53-826(+)
MAASAQQRSKFMLAAPPPEPPSLPRRRRTVGRATAVVDSSVDETDEVTAASAEAGRTMPSPYPPSALAPPSHVRSGTDGQLRQAKPAVRPMSAPAGVSMRQSTPALRFSESVESRNAFCERSQGCESRNLTQLHYEQMRRTSAQRAVNIREREEQMERTRQEYAVGFEPPVSQSRRRPASASAVQGHSGNRGLSGDGRGSGGCRSGEDAQTLPRRPYTALPGYTGYVPRKHADNIIACTFARGNARSQKLLMKDGAL